MHGDEVRRTEVSNRSLQMEIKRLSAELRDSTVRHRMFPELYSSTSHRFTWSWFLRDIMALDSRLTGRPVTDGIRRQRTGWDGLKDSMYNGKASGLRGQGPVTIKYKIKANVVLLQCH